MFPNFISFLNRGDCTHGSVLGVVFCVELEWVKMACKEHDVYKHAAKKLTVKDLSLCEKSSNNEWELTLKLGKFDIAKQIIVSRVWLQGYVEQIAGKQREILIVRDDTGRVKVTQCNNIPGDTSWIMKGVYCSVIGDLVRTSGLPEVVALKLTDLSSNHLLLSAMWPTEVEDFKYFISGQSVPSVV